MIIERYVELHVFPERSLFSPLFTANYDRDLVKRSAQARKRAVIGDEHRTASNKLSEAAQGIGLKLMQDDPDDSDLRWPEVLLFCQDALRQDPDNAQAWLWAAYSAMNSGKNLSGISYLMTLACKLRTAEKLLTGQVSDYRKNDLGFYQFVVKSGILHHIDEKFFDLYDKLIDIVVPKGSGLNHISTIRRGG